MDIKNTPIRNIKCFNSPDYTSLFCVAANYNILLVNYQALNVITTYDLINQFMQDNGYTNLVIFDVPKNSDVLALKEWPNLKGLFYESSDDSLFQQGLEAIEQGKLWFPRDVTDSWMRQMLASEQQTALQSSNLTCKEIKVLNLLFSGLHSTAIADSLFISEATVRVHLHKIYQKISAYSLQL